MTEVKHMQSCTLASPAKRRRTTGADQERTVQPVVLSWAKLIGGGEVAARTEAVSTAKTAVSEIDRDLGSSVHL